MTAARHDRPPKRRLGPYMLSSIAGVGGYLGGFVASTQLEDALGDVVRTSSIGFFLVMGLVRELVSRPAREAVRDGRRAW
jgi:hypothetical protein